MAALILYLLKVNVALVLFYLAYHFALRRLTFYTLNRFFLITAIIFSSLYPFANLSSLLKKNETLSRKFITIIPDFTSVQRIVKEPNITHSTSAILISQAAVPVVGHPKVKSQEFNYLQLFTILFWLGTALVAIRLLIQLLSFYRIHLRSKPEVVESYAFRNTDEKINPFSFWRNIYLNRDQHNTGLRSILEHEQVHVNQWHTMDILLSEISTVLYWFNPGAWMIKKAIRENLEFIADHRVLQNGMDSKMYQYTLLSISNLPQNLTLVNNFNFLTVKKRIMMMNKKKSPMQKAGRYLFFMPLIMLPLLAFNISKDGLEKKSFVYKAKAGIEAIANAVSSSVGSNEPAIQPAAKETVLDANTTNVFEDLKPEISANRQPASDTADVIYTSAEIQVLGSRIRNVDSTYCLFVVDGIPVRLLKRSRYPENVYASDFPSSAIMKKSIATVIKYDSPLYIINKIFNTVVMRNGYEMNTTVFSEGNVAGNQPSKFVNFIYSVPGQETNQNTFIHVSAGGFGFMGRKISPAKKIWEINQADKLLIKEADLSAGNTIWIYSKDFDEVYEKVNYNNNLKGSDLPAGKYYVIFNEGNGKKLISGNLEIKNN